MKIKFKLLILSLVLSNNYSNASTIKSGISNSSDNYFNYIKWLNRLNTLASGTNFIAKKYNPGWHFESLGSYQSGYGILKDSYLIYKGQNEFDLKTSAGLVIKALQINGYMTGYAIPGLSQIAFMYTAYTSYPSILNAFHQFTHTPLKVIQINAANPVLNISDFNDTAQANFSNSTYLRCSVLGNEKQLKIENSEFITKEDLPGLEEEKPSQYYKDHVIIYGRWIEITSHDKFDKQYAFATLNNPIEIQEACLRKYQSYFNHFYDAYKAEPSNKYLEKLYFDHKYIFDKAENLNKYLVPTAGNTNYSDHYPILFYTKIDNQHAIRLAPKQE